MKTLKLYFRNALLISFLLLTGRTFAQCPTGLISYWKMNETGGVTLIDNAGGFNAICNTVPGVDPAGRIGSAHFFSADTNSGVTAAVANSAAYDFPDHTGFTLIYWVKFSLADLDGRDHVIISRGNYHEGNPPGTFWSGGVGGEGNLNFILQDSLLDREDLQTPFGYADGKWHQVAFVRNETAKTNTLFVDGTEAVKITHDYSGGFTSVDPLQFGGLKNTVNNTITDGFFYQGSLDEVSILNVALTGEELNNQVVLANSDVGICDGLSANLLSVPVTTAILGSLYNYKVHAGGLQNGMSYSLVSGPEGMAIDSLTGMISWTPSDITTQALVTVTAKNYLPPADTQTFRIFLSEGTPCPENLLVLLKLDETFGPVYADYYGEHNATADVSPVATQGKIGRAQLFNDNSALDIPDKGTEFDWLQDASFSFQYWLKTTSAKSMVCMARHRLDGLNTAFMSSGTDESGKAQFELRDNGGKSLISVGTTMIADGNWHYIINVRNGVTKENRIYVDGLEESIQSVTYENSFIADLPTPINVGYLQRKNADEPHYHLTGSLDEVAIFTRAISPEEAFSFYNQGKPLGHCGAGNYAPYVTSQAVTLAELNSAYSYFFMAEDPDTSDVLTLSAVEKPQWLTFNWLAGQRTASLAGIPTSAGQYPVKLRVSDGSVEIDQEYTIEVSGGNPTGINDPERDGFVIYPVPASDKLVVSFKELNSRTSLEIINSEGRVMRQAVVNPGQQMYIFGLKDMKDGTYFLRVQNDVVNRTQGFVIAR
jgi:hypothetical protein